MPSTLSSSTCAELLSGDCALPTLGWLLHPTHNRLPAKANFILNFMSSPPRSSAHVFEQTSSRSSVARQDERNCGRFKFSGEDLHAAVRRRTEPAVPDSRQVRRIVARQVRQIVAGATPGTKNSEHRQLMFA
jgi:hypothetical protein